MATKPSPRGRRHLLARLGGGDPRFFEEARVDITELRGRGIAALIPAIFGSLAAMIAFRFAYSLPLGPAAAVGAGWGVVVLCFDLSLMSVAAGKGRTVSLAVALGGRALVSVLAAFTFASPIAIAIFAKDIATQVTVDQQHDLARYNDTVIIPAYAAKIASDQKLISQEQGKINSAQQRVTYWQQQVETDTIQATCEAQGVSNLAGCQSGSGQAGNGSVYSVRQTELQAAEANLATAKNQLQTITAAAQPQITAAQQDLTSRQHQQQADYRAAQSRYLADNGLIARWRALGELENASPTVQVRVWLIEALIVAVDLSAVISRLTSKTPVIDALRAADGRMAMVAAVAKADRENARLKAETEIRNARLRTRLATARLKAMGQLAVEKWRAEQRVADQMSGGVFYVTRDDGRTATPTDFARELSAALTAFRALDGLSRKEVADLLGHQNSRQVGLMEAAEKNPNMDVVGQLISGLGWDMHISLAPRPGIPHPDVQLKVTKVPPALPPGSSGGGKS
jgi:uncharacterized protein DUF4407